MSRASSQLGFRWAMAHRNDRKLGGSEVKWLTSHSAEGPFPVKLDLPSSVVLLERLVMPLILPNMHVSDQVTENSNQGLLWDITTACACTKILLPSEAARREQTVGQAHFRLMLSTTEWEELNWYCPNIFLDCVLFMFAFGPAPLTHCPCYYGAIPLPCVRHMLPSNSH